jgi:hypothetical protein
MKKGTIVVSVKDSEGVKAPIANARVRIYTKSDDETQGKKAKKQYGDETLVFQGDTDQQGFLSYDTAPGSYLIVGEAFGKECSEKVNVDPGCTSEVNLTFPIGFEVLSYVMKEECGSPIPCNVVYSGTRVKVQAVHKLSPEYLRENPAKTTFIASGGSIISTGNPWEYFLDTEGVVGKITWKLGIKVNPGMEVGGELEVEKNPVQKVSGDLGMTLKRTAAEPTPDLPLWLVIDKSTQAMSFNNYQKFIDFVLCNKPLSEEFMGTFEGKKFDPKQSRFNHLRQRRFLPFTDTDAYRLLKVATEAFVIVNCGVALSEFPFTPEDLTS